MLLIFTNRCINIYIKVDESGVKGWKVDKVDNFVDNTKKIATVSR